MANELEKAGSQGKQTRFRPLPTNRFFSGLWTQRNPLRDAATSMMSERFYGSRMDALIDGANIELTNRLTLQRRPGLTVYNSQNFPQINTFYSFHQTIDNVETITVMADTQNNVYDASGPSTKVSIFSKSSGAGQTSFLGVGNKLFMGDGIDAIQWDGTTVSSWGTAAPPSAPNITPLAYLGAPIRYWGPNMQVQSGYAILDSNGNVQLCTNLLNVSKYLTTYAAPSVLINGGSNVPGDYELGVDQGHNPIQVGTASAYTNAASAIDGTSSTDAYAIRQHSHAYYGCVFGFTYTGTLGAITQLKLNVLSSVAAPILTKRDAGIWYSLDSGTNWTKIYQSANRPLQWDTVILPGGTDPNNVQVLAFTDSHDDMGHEVYEVNVTADVTLVSVSLGTNNGTTGSVVPPWNTALYGSTSDGTAVWQNMGPISQWQANTTYNFAGPSACILDSNGNLQVIKVPGVTGPSQPNWNNALAPGSTIVDGTVTWLNVGPGNTLAYSPTGWDYVYAYHTTSGHVSTASPASSATGPVLGTMGVPISGVGSADPACDFIWIFRTVDGGSTFLQVADVNANPIQIANPGLTTVPAVAAGVTIQGVTFLSTTDGAAADNVTIQLVSVGTADASAISTIGDAVTVDIKRVDTSIRTITDIVALFATYGATNATTTSGGVTQATGSGATPMTTAAATHLVGGANSFQTPAPWTYKDVAPDSYLNEFIQAPINHNNDMPNDAITDLCFHLGRIWGSYGNTVIYSRVTDLTAGDPLQSFPPSNYLVFPSKVTKLYASGMGLLVFTISDVYLVSWQGTSSSILQVVPYVQGVGLLSPNAFDVNGAIVYFHTSDGQIVAFDPSGGISEIGFPIGDQVTWSPKNTYLTWHVSGSSDKAIYVTDGSSKWYRCNTTAAPETGLSWSTVADFTAIGGIGCVQSVEISPGVKRLLVSGASTQILVNDDTHIGGTSENGFAAMAFSPDGSTFYYVDQSTPNVLYKVDWTTHVITSVNLPNDFYSAGRLIIDTDGYLYMVLGSPFNYEILYKYRTSDLSIVATLGAINSFSGDVAAPREIALVNKGSKKWLMLLGNQGQLTWVDRTTMTLIRSTHSDNTFSMNGFVSDSYGMIADTSGDVWMIRSFPSQDMVLYHLVLNADGTFVLSNNTLTGYQNLNGLVYDPYDNLMVILTNTTMYQYSLASFNFTGVTGAVSGQVWQRYVGSDRLFAASQYLYDARTLTLSRTLTSSGPTHVWEQSIWNPYGGGSLAVWVVTEGWWKIGNALLSSSQPILQRDLSTFSDNGTTYAAHATIGSIVLAHPGQLAELGFVAADCTAVGSHPTLGVRLDEISGAFGVMSAYVADPPTLPSSSTLYGMRYYFNQTQQPAWCRHLQLDIEWPSEAAKNEILTYTIYGATWNE